MVVCISEDRKWCETSVKLLVLSLNRHCPDLAVELFYPPADARFRTWLKRCPRVHLNVRPFENVTGFNVKPVALLALMDRGHRDLLWLDSDIIVTRDFRPLMAGLAPDTLVAAEEALYGAFPEDPHAMRARAWGFRVGRTLEHAANSCVVRVTGAHRPLLERWRHHLGSSVYLKAQSMNWALRPAHMYGDQDVLTALLASREFSGIPLRFLKRGGEIVQFFGPCGYTVWERLRHMAHGRPAFLHSQVTKPWVEGGQEDRISMRQYFNRLYLDLSPYTLEARRFRHELEEDCAWMRPRMCGSRLLRIAGLGWPPLVGLPLALMADLLRVAKRFLCRSRGETADCQGES